ncbi:hypothetical protein TNIN_394841 [Trichonephila inaurata madagascariensis]|uniref:Uncharacterized protein n=1 Tax=Trichonephila inaurata madagascariensis TaxID=2747483 RepID=A0A8X6YGA9_9ARAC|nr:hypothetical protein TNIN_394841 [Trichonephila inaurata madagascariensis]
MEQGLRAFPLLEDLVQVYLAGTEAFPLRSCSKLFGSESSATKKVGTSKYGKLEGCRLGQCDVNSYGLISDDDSVSDFTLKRCRSIISVSVDYYLVVHAWLTTSQPIKKLPCRAAQIAAFENAPVYSYVHDVIA